MARLPRNTFPPPGIFQITTRGVEQRDVYLDRDDRLAFLAQLRHAADQNGWNVYAGCLMTNHYHLVVEGMRDLISRGMRRLNGVYAEGFNLKYDRSGHLWGDRFALWQVRDEEHLLATCRYVLLNPVRAGLCRRVGDWEWTWSRFGLDPS